MFVPVVPLPNKFQKECSLSNAAVMKLDQHNSECLSSNICIFGHV